MADIDIEDSDVRPLYMTAAGASGAAVIEVQFVALGELPDDDAYIEVEWTDGTHKSVDLLLGLDGGFDLVALGLGTFAPVVRVTDVGNVKTVAGPDYLVIKHVGP